MKDGENPETSVSASCWWSLGALLLSVDRGFSLSFPRGSFSLPDMVRNGTVYPASSGCPRCVSSRKHPFLQGDIPILILRFQLNHHEAAVSTDGISP